MKTFPQKVNATKNQGLYHIKESQWKLPHPMEMKLEQNWRDVTVKIKWVGNSIKLNKKIFHNKNVSKDLNKYVNDKNFDRKLRHLERKVRKLKLKQTQTGKRKAENGSGAMGFAGEGAQGDQFPERQSKLSAAGGGGDMMKFNFLPGFAGMPFPPFMMNGPHFHPPVAVTVNSIPNPNPRSVLNPFEIEQSNLKKQIDELSNVKDSLSMLEAKMNRVDNNIQLSLDDKYNRILQLNN